MASGFFLGGLSEGFQGQEALNTKANYQQSILQLEQQRLMQSQQNQQRAEYMKLRSDLVAHIGETVTQLKNAHPDWTDLQIASNPAVVGLKNSLSTFTKNLQLPDDSESIIAGMAAGKSQIQTEGELARAKEGPQHQALVQSEIEKNKATAENLNPDLDRTTQLGGQQISPQAKAIGEYRAPPYTGYSSRSPQARLIMDEVYANYPGYDAKNYKVQQSAAGAEVRADSNTLTKLTGQREAITAFEDMTVANGDLLLKLAQKVDATGRPVIDRWIRAGRQNVSGDLDVSAFNQQLNAFKVDMARVIANPNLTGQLTDKARSEAQSLNEGSNPEQILKVFETFKLDAQNRKKGLDDAISRVRGRLDSASGKKKDNTEDNDPLGLLK